MGTLKRDDNHVPIQNSPAEESVVDLREISGDEASFPSVSSKIEVSGYNTLVIFQERGSSDVEYTLNAGAINQDEDGFNEYDSIVLSDDQPVYLNVAGLDAVQVRGDNFSGTTQTATLKYKLMNM